MTNLESLALIAYDQYLFILYYYNLHCGVCHFSFYALHTSTQVHYTRSVHIYCISKRALNFAL